MIKTKQELLNHFSDINAMYNNPFMYQTLSNMIDELLEQQPCEDCISREEAIRIAEQGQIQGYEWQFKRLCTLPSVTPKPKTGHWIKLEPYPLQMHEYECSECGNETDDNTENYCSECGAYMAESEDEE